MRHTDMRHTDQADRDPEAPPAGRPGTVPASFVTHHPSFADVLGPAPRLELVLRTDAHEGPVYAAGEDALYYTSLPRAPRVPGGAPVVAIRRLALDGERFPRRPGDDTVVVARTRAANGMAPDRHGHLVVCEQGTPAEPARIARLDLATGRLATVVDAFEGQPLSSPNDVTVRADGTIWFTDPAYGHLQGFRPAPSLADAVYRYDPAGGRLTVADRSFTKPNGLAFSPDQRTLYVTDSGANLEPGSDDPRRPHEVVAFDVLDGGRLTNRRRLAVVTPGVPDGVTTDDQGRVYASAGDGVHVLDPDGRLLGAIRLPGAVNFTFGGPAGNVLFITADDALWAAVLATTAATSPTTSPSTPTSQGA